MSWSKGIKFYKKKKWDTCDICGLNNQLIESEPFDTGNAETATVKFCRSCLRSIDMVFDGDLND